MHLSAYILQDVTAACIGPDMCHAAASIRCYHANSDQMTANRRPAVSEHVGKFLAVSELCLAS